MNHNDLDVNLIRDDLDNDLNDDLNQDELDNTNLKKEQIGGNKNIAGITILSGGLGKIISTVPICKISNIIKLFFIFGITFIINTTRITSGLILLFININCHCF